MRGYVHVYTGDGKGKTTAAIGLAVRASGSGLRVLFVQCVKTMEFSKIKALEQFSDRISVRQYGRDWLTGQQAGYEDAKKNWLQNLRHCLKSGYYDVVILDEASIALHYCLFTVEELLESIRGRHCKCEIVVTGRYAPRKLINTADLVTEMKEIKHYFTKGVTARDGIER